MKCADASAMIQCTGVNLELLSDSYTISVVSLQDVTLPLVH